MPTSFSMVRDINAFNGFGLPFSIDKYSATIVADTDATLTVPSTGPLGSSSSTYSNKFIVIFSYEAGASVWVANNTTAAKPAGATFASTSSELNPSARYVKAGDVLHFLTPDTSAEVSVVFYALF